MLTETSHQTVLAKVLDTQLQALYGELSNKRLPRSKKSIVQNSMGVLAAAGTAVFAADNTCLGAVSYSGPVNEVRKNGIFSFDMDGDGTDDFRIRGQFREFIPTSTLTTSSFLSAFTIRGLNGASVAVTHPTFGVVSQLASSDNVSSGRIFKDEDVLISVSGYPAGGGTSSFGSFLGDGFAGAKLRINGQDHFGWIHLDIDMTEPGDLDGTLTLIDWAYETTPNTPIRAGDTGTTLPGDFNGDGEVDGDDFLQWQRGETDPPLDSDDLQDWRSNYGTPPATVRAVPEPSTAGLLGLSLLAAGATGIRNWRQQSTPDL